MKKDTQALLSARPTAALATVIKNCRTDLGLTQREFIEMLQSRHGYTVARTAVSFWENGTMYPPNELIDILIKITGNPELTAFKRIAVADVNHIASQLSSVQQEKVFRYALELLSLDSESRLESRLESRS